MGETLPLIRLANVAKQYTMGQSQVVALRDVTLNIAPGEFTAVVGPSGSGKTTLLNIIGCLDNVDSGTYHLDGIPIDTRDFDTLATVRNEKIGFIFQSFNLIPVLSAVENIEFPCLIRNTDRRALRARAMIHAQAVGLGKFVHHRPDELSGGQRQRVAIARALITEPRLVLADEPTANLDSVVSDQILELMLQLNRSSHVTFLFSTHDPRVLRYARRVVTMQDGAIVSDVATAGSQGSP